MGIPYTAGMRVMSLSRGAETYLFMYDDSSKRALVDTWNRFAMDSSLSFTIHDSAVMQQRLLEIEDKVSGESHG